MSGNKIQKDVLSNWIVDAFPVPRYMRMPSAALDISPNSVKYLDCKYTSKGFLPTDFKEVFLPEGTIVDGIVKDEEVLSKALSEIREQSVRKFVFVAIPENALYLYTVVLKGSPSRKEILHQVEFSFKEHVPISLENAIYDFDIVGRSKNGTLVSVTVAPKSVINKYERVLSSAGFVTRVIELEAHSVARSVSDSILTIGVEMVVDIGYQRAGIIIIKKGLPIFSITIPGGSKMVAEVIDECKKQYTFWDTRTNSKGRRIERISRVTVCGGAGKEVVESLREVLNRDVAFANVWKNLFNIDDYIPNINSDEAQGMATLAGLLLKNKD